jgi:hypothetical protein
LSIIADKSVVVVQNCKVPTPLVIVTRLTKVWLFPLEIVSTLLLVHVPAHQTMVISHGNCQYTNVPAHQTMVISHGESQWRSGSASVSNVRGLGFEARQGQGFSSSYETPELLGAGDSHILRMRR